MGWFKRLFHQRMSLDEVKSHLKKEKAAFDGRWSGAKEDAKQRFIALSDELKGVLAKFSAVELMNPNIPWRAKQVMEGNREQFIRLTSQLSEKLSVPEQSDLLGDFSMVLTEYVERSARNAVILSEFFEDDVRSVRSVLRGFEGCIQPLGELAKESAFLGRVECAIADVERANAERSQKEEERVALKASIAQLEEFERKCAGAKTVLINKEEYVRMKAEILESVKARQEAVDEIVSLFGPLADAAKKYGHSIKNEQLMRYGDDALDALIHDYSFQIADHSSSIRLAIERNLIGLPTERAKRALESLKLLTKEYLGMLVHQYANARKKESSLQAGLLDRPVMREFERLVLEQKEVKRKIE